MRMEPDALSVLLRLVHPSFTPKQLSDFLSALHRFQDCLRERNRFLQPRTVASNSSSQLRSASTSVSPLSSNASSNLPCEPPSAMPLNGFGVARRGKKRKEQNTADCSSAPEIRPHNQQKRRKSDDDLIIRPASAQAAFKSSQHASNSLAELRVTQPGAPLSLDSPDDTQNKTASVLPAFSGRDQDASETCRARQTANGSSFAMRARGNHPSEMRRISPFTVEIEDDSEDAVDREHKASRLQESRR